VEDEFSKASPVWQRAGDGSLTGAGSLSLLSLEQTLGVEAPLVDANSVGGLVIETLGAFRPPASAVAFPEFDLEVLSVDGPRIHTVRVVPTRVTPVPGAD